MGSTCIYPKDCPQPIKEEYLLTGPLEYTNEAYAIAKIAGMKMCESYNLQYGTNFICVMPTNLYGPKDNFDFETSHVLPALIRKMYLGKALEENNWQAISEDLRKRPLEGIGENSKSYEVLAALERYGIRTTPKVVTIEIWGTGSPLREFLWSEDLADACTFLMKHLEFDDIVDLMLTPEDQKQIRNTHINIGTGKEISIKDLAFLVKDITGFKGDLFFNTSKNDGTLRKVTDSSKLKNLGWNCSVDLREGVERLVTELTRIDLASNEPKIRFSSKL
jgi:GDP-L-fucose synthase